MGRKEKNKESGQKQECAGHGFLDGEAMALLMGTSHSAPAMIDPPDRVVPSALPMRPKAKTQAGYLFGSLELLCA